MRFQELTLTNFKTYYNDHSFNLGGFDEGLYHITGKNEVEPELGANGCGKSNLFDGLLWVLYGKTTRGLRASNIHSWGAKGKTEGALGVDIGGVVYTILRSWNPNKLTLQKADGEPRTVSQEDINSLIGLDVDEFQFTILIGQFSSNFLDYPPMQKLEVFTNVLKLDYWDDLSELASKRLVSIENETNGFRNKLAEQKGWRLSQKEELSRLKAAHTKFEAEKQKKITQIKSTIDALEVRKKQKLKSQRSIKKGIKDLSKVLLKAESSLRERGTELNRLRKEAENVRVSLKVGQSEIQKLEALEDKFKSIGPQCPNCGQKVSTRHIRKEKNALAKKKNKLEKNMSIKTGRYEALKEKGFSAANDVRRGELAVKELSIKSSNFRIQLQKIKGDIKNYTAKRDQAQRTLERGIETNPFDTPIRDIKKAISESKEKARVLRASVKRRNKIAGQFEFWQKEFRLIRLTVVEKALAEFGLEVNSALSQLGLSNWDITFDIKRETKAGNISKGFNVMVSSPYTNEKVPWESWSGGENQRLRVAVSMGLMNLILGKKAIAPNIEVYDEPTRHLSQEGISDLLNTLKERSLTLHKTIYLVDHHSLDFGGFAGQVLVLKTDKGSVFGK